MSAALSHADIAEVLEVRLSAILRDETDLDSPWDGLGELIDSMAREVMQLARPENEVKAEALEEAADAVLDLSADGACGHRLSIASWMAHRAAALRSGDVS